MNKYCVYSSYGMLKFKQTWLVVGFEYWIHLDRIAYEWSVIISKNRRKVLESAL